MTVCSVSLEYVGGVVQDVGLSRHLQKGHQAQANKGSPTHIVLDNFTSMYKT